MAKTAAKQPIGPPEPDAHISMYEQAKWPLTKRDQTYLSQANKFWNFISTDSFLVGCSKVAQCIKGQGTHAAHAHCHLTICINTSHAALIPSLLPCLCAASQCCVQSTRQILPCFACLGRNDQLAVAQSRTCCVAQGITDRSQLLDLTHRACTKRYILYMHKMNKRENVRAAVDMHCLGLSPSQAQQEVTAAETELEQQRSAGSGAFPARAGSGYSIEQIQQMQAQQASGPEAAGHLAPGTLSERQFSGEGSVYSDAPESPSGTRSSRRSSRLKPSQSEGGPSVSALHPELPEHDQPPSAGRLLPLTTHGTISPPVQARLRACDCKDLSQLDRLP